MKAWLKTVWYWIVLIGAGLIAAVWIVFKLRGIWKVAFGYAQGQHTLPPSADPDDADDLAQKEYLAAYEQAKHITSIVAQTKRDDLVERIQKRMGALKGE